MMLCRHHSMHVWTRIKRCLSSLSSCSTHTHNNESQFLSSKPLAITRRPPRHSQRILVQVLERCGTQKEVEQYLRLYSSLPSSKFAVIHASGDVLDNELDQLVQSISYLYEVELYPIIVHGVEPQLARRLKQNNIATSAARGRSLMTPEVLNIACQTFQTENLRLVKALEKKNVKARPIHGGVFGAERIDPRFGGGLVGDVSAISLQPIHDAIQEGYLPILTSMAMSSEGQSLHVNADVAATALAKAVQPLKVIYISTTGGFRNESNNLITNIDVGDSGFEAVLEQSWCMPSDKLQLLQMKTLIDSLSESSTVAFTTAKLLAQELFTHKGSGTLLRKLEKIRETASLDQFDRNRLCALLEKSYGRSLRPFFFGSLSGAVDTLYISQCYRACAFVATLSDGSKYLDKFAVDQISQSSGLGQRIWDLVIKNHPCLCWRSCIKSPLNAWYFTKADGTLRSSCGKWIVFWYGEMDPEDFYDELITKRSAFETSHNNQQAMHLVVPRSRERIGIVGTRGYATAELLSLVGRHSSLELGVVSSSSMKGEPVSKAATIDTDLLFEDLTPEDVAKRTDITTWVLALPDDMSVPFVSAIPEHVKIMDMSADHRYSIEWVYGLPEQRGQREKIRKSHRVANPGGFATCAQIALLPLAETIGGKGCMVRDAHIFGVIGYSSAGTVPRRRNDVNVLHDNILAYKQTKHFQQLEMSHFLGFNVSFMPHVSSWFRGIHMTISVRLDRGMIDSHNSTWLKALYMEYYLAERFVNILAVGMSGVPEVKDNVGQPFAHIGGFWKDSRDSSRIVINATIDNLMKGSASQAMQNINIMHGFDECDGILPLQDATIKLQQQQQQPKQQEQEQQEQQEQQQQQTIPV